MAFGRFQDFLGALVKRQRGLFFSGSEAASIDELVNKLMGTVGEVSGIVTARQVLDHYKELPTEQKLLFFENLEKNFNADKEEVKIAFKAYEKDPSSANTNSLSKAAEPLRHEVLRRLNQTPDATHDLVGMRTDLLKLLEAHPQLKAVDEDFVRLFTSWFGRGFLVLQTVNWATSAAVLERIIRYEAVHEIKDWEDLRSRIDPPNRRCFAFFHPALIDEPLIFVEVA
ncbi:MAG: malonyl-CoA decarboxylase family protein, partial [Pseudomonadota bacterium]|nr:malonyl-CoA decarboxylase family protein [Pseudomonadota bacterium]